MKQTIKKGFKLDKINKYIYINKIVHTRILIQILQHMFLILLCMFMLKNKIKTLHDA